MIKINLSRILGEKRISQAELSRKTGIRPNTISELYNEFSDKVKLKHIELICTALDCNIGDIFEIIPDKVK